MCTCVSDVAKFDDDETVATFKETIATGTVDVAKFGDVLKSGWGQDPPNEVKDWIDKIMMLFIHNQVTV